MDELIARENLRHLREALAADTNEVKRKTLARLISEEEARLAKAIEAKKKST